jgi:hypothetical protein
MTGLPSVPDPQFLSDVFRESYSHYRHLEILRKDHLNIFLVINAALVAILGSSSGVGVYVQQSGRLVEIALMIIVFSAFVFYFISRIGEAAKKQHQVIMEEIIEARLGPGNVWARSFRSSKGRFSSYSTLLLNKIGVFRVSTLMLLPYLLVMWLYVTVAIVLEVQSFEWPPHAIAAIATCSVVIAALCALLCTVDFLGFAGPRTLVPAE